MFELSQASHARDDWLESYSTISLNEITDKRHKYSSPLLFFCGNTLFSKMLPHRPSCFYLSQPSYICEDYDGSLINVETLARFFKFLLGIVQSIILYNHLYKCPLLYIDISVIMLKTVNLSTTSD